MKLTMKDDYTFQKLIGFPDDPEMMSTEDVKSELGRWSEVIGSWMEGDEPSVDQIAGLDGFLSALATEEVEYEEPLEPYTFTVTVEFYQEVELLAKDRQQAIEKLEAELDDLPIPRNCGWFGGDVRAYDVNGDQVAGD